MILHARGTEGSADKQAEMLEPQNQRQRHNWRNEEKDWCSKMPYLYVVCPEKSEADEKGVEAGVAAGMNGTSLFTLQD